MYLPDCNKFKSIHIYIYIYIYILQQKAERMRTDCFTRRKIIYFKDSASSLFLFSTVALPNINQVTKQENIQENILLSYSFPMIFKQLLKGDL